MREIVIGSGDTSGSWIVCYEGLDLFYISKNDRSYRLQNLLFGFKILLFRDTLESATLEELLCKPIKDDDVLWQYTNSLAVANITAEEYINALNETLQKVEHEDFRKAANYIRKELKELLDIK